MLVQLHACILNLMCFHSVVAASFKYGCLMLCSCLLIFFSVGDIFIEDFLKYRGFLSLSVIISMKLALSVIYSVN